MLVQLSLLLVFCCILEEEAFSFQVFNWVKSSVKLGSFMRKRQPIQLTFSTNGKFVKVGDSGAPKEFGPPTIISAGYTENELDIIDFALENLLQDISSPSPAPVIVLGETDNKKTLSELLEDRFERDHVLPRKRISVSESSLQPPLLIFSGMSMVNIKQIVYILMQNGLRKPAVAIAVPNNLNKMMEVLTDEIANDFVLNSKRQNH